MRSAHLHPAVLLLQLILPIFGEVFIADRLEALQILCRV